MSSDKAVKLHILLQDGGFSVDGPESVLVGQNTTLKCSASRYNFSADSIEWYKDSLTTGKKMLTSDPASRDLRYDVSLTQTDFSYTKELKLYNVTLNERGNYMCRVRLLEPSNGGQYPQRPQTSSWTSARRRSYSPRRAGAGTYFYGQDNLQQELSLHLEVLSPEPPLLVNTNLKPEVNKTKQPLLVAQPEDGLELFCRVSGRPRPQMKWYLNGLRLTSTTTTTRVQLTDEDQVVRINYVSPKDEGLYECKAENMLGYSQAARLVRLQESFEREAVYANISLPVIVAVVIALMLVLVLIIIAKLCYNKAKKAKGHHQQQPSTSCNSSSRGWKDPPTPPTPRLMQFEMPLTASSSRSRSTTNGEACADDEECRVTLTSNSNRDEGSISPVPTIHCDTLGSGIGVPGGHLCHCHLHPTYYPSSSMMPKCSICDFNTAMPPTSIYGGGISPPAGTTPIPTLGIPTSGAYATTTLGRPLLHHTANGHAMHYNANADGIGLGVGGTLLRNSRYDNSHRSRSHSPPRLSAEF